MRLAGRLLLAAFGAGAWVAFSASACSAPETYGRPQQETPTTGAGGGGLEFDAGVTDGPPAADAPGLCGNQIHQIVTDAPNLYFVFDASGSMGELEPQGVRYDVVRIAAVNLVRKLGALVNIGAAVFPYAVTPTDSCHVGAEVFPVTQGDVAGPEEGPTTKGFRISTLVTPNGGTPTSATLDALAPALAKLPGKTIVLLATDGGPNCNPQAICTKAECQANLDAAPDCDPAINCCAPNQSYGPTSCIDHDASVAAIAAIAQAGIDTYVIGINGSQKYQAVLDDMAVAGGKPQATSPYYYRVDDLGTLEGTFGAIASVVVSCTFELTDPPPAEGDTNVYLDDQVLPLDPTNGWGWTGPSTIELYGEACVRLKNGEVKQVQIVSGCPTEVPH